MSVMKPYSSGSGADGTAPESPRAVRDGSVGRKYTAGIGVRFRSGELTESRETLGPNKHTTVVEIKRRGTLLAGTHSHTGLFIPDASDSAIDRE